MSQRRTLILVAAIAIGALASFLVWNYVNGVKDDAYGSAQRVKVFLVKQSIPKNTYGQEAEAYITQDEIPSKFLPPNAVQNLDDIRDKVSITDLVPNQVVVSDMFVDSSDPAASASFADRIKKIRGEDMTAITIQVDKIKGVAGLLQPGDFVNVMVTDTSDETDQGGDSASADTGGKEVLFAKQARYLYQKLEILAVGKRPVPEPGEAAAAASGTDGAAPTAATAGDEVGTLTLLVPAKAAQYIASVPPGNIYLALVSRDYKPVPQSKIDPKAPLPAENGDELTPYGPNGPK